MKKFLALLLALCLAFCLAACGGQSADTPSDTTSKTPGDTASETPNDVQKSDVEIEPMELLFISTQNEKSSTGEVIQYFCDYVTEASGGAITFNMMWSGTFCSMREELSSVGSGSADICALNPLPFSAQLPLTTYPNGTCNGYEGTVDYAKYILFENEETASAISAEFEDNNIHYVGFSLNGNSGYYCNFPAYKLEDMAGKKFGTSKSGALQKEYGLNIVSCEDSARYDSLQRAVIDCCDFILPMAYNMSFQEVTTHWVFYNYVTYGNMFSLNLDRWNSLSPEAQKIFEDAGAATLEYSVERMGEYEQEIIADVESSGVEVTFVDDPDFAATSFSIDANNALANASKAGKLDEMKTIISAAADFLVIDVDDILAQY